MRNRLLTGFNDSKRKINCGFFSSLSLRKQVCSFGHYSVSTVETFKDKRINPNNKDAITRLLADRLKERLQSGQQLFPRVKILHGKCNLHSK